MPSRSEGKPETFTNPVYPHSFPDPFVLKFRGEYFAYCTGDAPDGNVFGILRSGDLVHWEPAGSAMSPLASSPPFYWAPEVIYDNGRFYCYYSAGNEVLMELRVAVSARPDGGFLDAGVRLTHEDFAIDAHVFIDDDGKRYLFYATDFLKYTHIGTGTVVDRMLDWKTLEGKPRPVTRAKYDWQVYDPARKEKGGVRWYTVEGPTVLKRKRKYFEMFSGGNWQNNSYGVSFAVSDSINSDDEWHQFSDGEKILPILRTIPDKVIGPGHNSVIRGPNNRELYCVYHRWTTAGRVLAIDRMDFAGDRIFIAGPTTTAQLMPFAPQRVHQVYLDDKQNELSIDVCKGQFLLELMFRFIGNAPDAEFGFCIGDEVKFQLSAATSTATLNSSDAAPEALSIADLDLETFHLIRIESGLETCSVILDDIGRQISARYSGHVGDLRLFAHNVKVEISAIEITRGFEELFETDGDTPGGLLINGQATVKDGSMSITGNSEMQLEAAFDVGYLDFEFAANVSAGCPDNAAVYGVRLDSDGLRSLILSVSAAASVIRFQTEENSAEITLPEAFVGTEFRQFRIVVRDGEAAADLDGISIATLPCNGHYTRAAIFGHSHINIETVRLTEI
jgi:GH43 family beta-xylosidase